MRLQRLEEEKRSSGLAIPGKHFHPGPLLEYVQRLSPKYLPPRHLLPMIQRLERYKTEPFQLLVSCPPRHAKTETMLHFIPWVLQQEPEKTLGYLTYAADLAVNKAAKARALTEAAGIQLATRKVSHWQTMDGGGLISGGAGGPLTGKGLDLAIVDDPYKNRVEAESPRRRQVLEEWFEDVVMTRIEPGGSTIVFHTRWHESDLISWIQKEKGWEYINLPALSEDIHETPLWPERWSKAALVKKREDVGEFTWASLYSGHPRPRGDRVFPDAFTYPAGTAAVGARVAIGLDLAYTDKNTSDWCVAVVMARIADKFFVLDVVRKRTTPTKFLGDLMGLANRYPTARFRFYGTGPELGSIDFFRAAMRRRFIEAIQASADKFVRAIPVAAAWCRGDVLVPGPNEDRGLSEPAWLEDFLAEVNGFTGVGDAHDDQVDAMAAAYDALASMPGLSGGGGRPGASTGRRM